MSFKTKWVLGHGIITAIIYSVIVVVVYDVLTINHGYEILLFAGFGVCIGVAQGILLFGIKRPLHALSWAMTTSLAFNGGLYIAAIISISILYFIDAIKNPTQWYLILSDFSFITIFTSFLIATIQSALIIIIGIEQNKQDWRQKTNLFWKEIQHMFSMRWYQTTLIGGFFASLTGTVYLLIVTNPKALSYITIVHMGIAQTLAALILAYFTKNAAAQLHETLNTPPSTNN